MRKRIEIVEVRHDNWFYFLFALISNPSFSDFSEYKDAEYILDLENSELIIRIDDVAVTESIKKINHDKQTFVQKNKKYHFKYI